MTRAAVAASQARGGDILHPLPGRAALAAASTPLSGAPRAVQSLGSSRRRILRHDGEPLRLERIVGEAADPAIAERLHALAHANAVESIVLGREDAARHRLRVKTDRGRDCTIALPRSQRLRNGAVLLLDARRAIVVRLREEAWLRLAPERARDSPGNIHCN